MPYTPPGVTTNVVINNTTVTLPGGTRILALVGNSNRQSSVSNEAQVQPASLSLNVNNSGLAAVSSIYDFSGPGQSLYTYQPSGTGAYGSGYYTVGNSINWTPAANQFPASTTPSVGSTYYVSYNYSGVASLESQTVPANVASGVGNVLNIKNVETITAVSGTVGNFSGTNYTSQAGYYVSGNSLLWSLGTEYATYVTAQAAGAIPSGQTTIFVNYTYSGTAIGESVIQNPTRNTQVNIASEGGNVITVISVSGASSAYPASGTITTPDTSGYGTSGSGYYQSGNSINWNPVNPSAYGYPSVTVPSVNDVFYINYTFNKPASAYSPKSYTTFTDVVSSYGQIASWNLITSGASAGTYQLTGINPLVLGASVAFQNNASLVMLVQNSGIGTTGGDYLNTLAELQTKTVDLIVPLTIGSGLSTIINGVNYITNNTGTNGNMSTVDIALALYYTKLHCDTMSNSINKMERVSLGSLGAAEIGDINTPNTYIYEASVSLDDKRISLVAPGTTTIQLQDPAGVFQNINVDGSFLAVAVAALSASPLNDVATPLTNQQLTGFTNISASTPGHVASDYQNVEMNNLAAAGCMVVAQQGPKIYVRQQLTTDQSNVVNGEFSVVTLIDYVSQAVRSSCNQFIGKKLVPQITIPSVKGTILATLQSLSQADIISSIGAITCQINPLNPTQLLVTAVYVPIFPLNQIIVTFTINTLG